MTVNLCKEQMIRVRISGHVRMTVEIIKAKSLGPTPKVEWDGEQDFVDDDQHESEFQSRGNRREDSRHAASYTAPRCYEFPNARRSSRFFKQGLRSWSLVALILEDHVRRCYACSIIRHL